MSEQATREEPNAPLYQSLKGHWELGGDTDPSPYPAS